jgi:hypothetical protein
MANQLVFIRRVLYDVKKKYGEPADLYVQTLSATDLTTGSKTISRVKYHIDRVPILPVKFFQQGLYTQGYLKAAREFTYGGYQDQDIKQFIIDGNDLPVGFEILPEHYFVVDHKRYEIAVITRIEENLGYLLIVKRLTGVEIDEVNEASLYQTIRFSHSVVVNKVNNLTVTQTLPLLQEASN